VKCHLKGLVYIIHNTVYVIFMKQRQCRQITEALVTRRAKLEIILTLIVYDNNLSFVWKCQNFQLWNWSKHSSTDIKVRGKTVVHYVL